MPVFTLTFWGIALESAMVSGSSAFLAAIPAVGAWNIDNLKIAGLGFITGALYSFIKQLGAVQALTAATKVSLGKHVAGRQAKVEGDAHGGWVSPR